MKKTYTKKQIQEAINYWTKQLENGNYILTESPNNANFKFNSQIQAITDKFKPVYDDICGMSVQQILDGDFTDTANKLLNNYAKSVGRTGTRYIPGAYSHAGFEYHNMLDVNFEFTDIIAKTFNARILYTSINDVRYVPDGNPYDGVSPERFKNKIISKVLFKFKSDFQLKDLTQLNNIKCKKAYLSGTKLKVKDLNNEDLKNNQVQASLLSIIDIEQFGIHYGNLKQNFSNFLTYAAAPILNQMLIKAQYVDIAYVKPIIKQIYNIPKLTDQLYSKDRKNANDTDAIFIRNKQINREKLKNKLYSKRLQQKAQTILKQCENDNETFLDVSERDDLGEIVSLMLGVDNLEDFCDPPNELTHDLEMARNEYFRESRYAEDLSETLLDKLVDEMLTVDEELFDSKRFTQMVDSIFDDSDMWDILDPYKYIETDDYYWD